MIYTPASLIGRNDIARRGGGAADEVAVTADNGDPGERIPECQPARRVRADEIALDDVTVRTWAFQPHPSLAVAREQVAGARIRSTDGIARRTINRDAVARIRDSQTPVGVRADVIAQDQIPSGA